MNRKFVLLTRIKPTNAEANTFAYTCTEQTASTVGKKEIMLFLSLFD